MKTLSTVHHAVIDICRQSASLFVILLLAASAIVSICFPGFAQIAVRNSAEETQTVETLPAANQKADAPRARRVFVRSKSLLVRTAVVEEKLLKRPEFQQLGF